MPVSKSIAGILLKLQAVSISPENPYTWASGLRSPLYCDNRLIISDVAARREVSKAFDRLIEAKGWRPNVIAGTATAGIPHAAWLAELLSLPMVYIRSAEKKHGKQNRIEGHLPAAARAVVIEDLISTGGSAIQAARALMEAGAEVLGVAAIFQYGLAGAAGAFADAGVRFATLTDLHSLLEEAIGRGLLDDAARSTVEAWRQDPRAWSDRRS